MNSCDPSPILIDEWSTPSGVRTITINKLVGPLGLDRMCVSALLLLGNRTTLGG